MTIRHLIYALIGILVFASAFIVGVVILVAWTAARYDEAREKWGMNE